MPQPTPMLDAKTPVDWLFLFKFNPAEEAPDDLDRPATGIFDAPGWPPPAYMDARSGRALDHSQQFAVASSASPALQQGRGILGSSLSDPLGATFAQIYDQPVYFVVWNDQFKGHPMADKGAPWGHSKGVLAWNDAGEGMVMQVSTPSWPGSGSSQHPRQGDGNTLGFVTDDDIEVSQHFFALKLTLDDVQKVLAAMNTASVVTDITEPSLVNNGGPEVVRALVKALANRDTHKECTRVTLSSGVQLIAKSSALCVPPWQAVSSVLGGVDLRVASWWTNPKILSSAAGAVPGCWDSSVLPTPPGAVQIALTGAWLDTELDPPQQRTLGLQGGSGATFNHAKLGVTTSGTSPLSIFGDMNQQGAWAAGDASAKQTCGSSQNGRGGMFFAHPDPALFGSLSAMLAGTSAPLRGAG